MREPEKVSRFFQLSTASPETPRRWSEHDVELVREVVERLWAAVERARAEAALRASEARFRTAFENASIERGNESGVN